MKERARASSAVALALVAAAVGGCNRVETQGAEDRARELGRAAATAGDSAVQTSEIKAALFADSTIDASRIDVDTSGATKTVTLKGAVATEAQKVKARAIAEEKAPGYQVRDELRVETASR